MQMSLMRLDQANNDKLFFLPRRFKIWNCERGQKVSERVANPPLAVARKNSFRVRPRTKLVSPKAMRSRRVKVNRRENLSEPAL